jgi:tetratricopeptide (TPR) repeat protein
MVGRVPEAMEHYRQALQLSREAAEDRTAQLMAGSLIVLDLGRSSMVEAGPAAPLPSGALGYASVSQLFGAALPVGRVREAQRALESALSYAREAGDRLGEAALTASLGLSQLDAEATEGAEALTRAEASFREALSVVEEVGNALSEASILGNLGRLYHLADRPAEAGTALREAEVLARRIGARRLQAWLSSLFGAVLADEDRASEAEIALDLGRDLALEANDQLAQGLNVVARGHLDLAMARQVAGDARTRLLELARGRTSQLLPDTDDVTPRKMAVSSVDLRLAMRVLEKALARAAG